MRLGLPGAGALIAAFGFVALAVPVSEEYANDPFGVTGGDVTINCGNGFSGEVEVDFEDDWEQVEYDGLRRDFGEPSWFEGETATQVCDTALGERRWIGFGAMALGGILLIVGVKRRSSSAATPPSRSGAPGVVPPQPDELPSWPVIPQADVAHGSSGTEGMDRPGFPPPTSVAERQPPEQEEGDDSTATRSRTDSATVGIRLSDGQIVDLSDQHAVIGRDPVAPPHLVGSATLRVDDLAVSKTHLAVGVSQGRAWVEDLHSTNGVEVVDPAGEALRLGPGERVFVDHGATIEFGDTRLTLTAGQEHS